MQSDEGIYPRAAPSLSLFINGLLTNSEQTTDWIASFNDACRDLDLRFYSYAPAGTALDADYDGDDTLRSFRQHARRYKDYCIELQSATGGSLVFTFSFGAVVLLLGAKALGYTGLAGLKRIVLVAPPFRTERLSTVVRMLQTLARLSNWNAPILFDLTAPAEALRSEIREALRGILSQGIDVVVVYSELDEFPGYQQLDLNETGPGVFAEIVHSPAPLPAHRRPFHYHFDLIRDQTYLEIICRLLRGVPVEAVRAWLQSLLPQELP